MMTVLDYFHDMVLGQKFAVEFDDVSSADEEGYCLRNTLHYVCGNNSKLPYGCNSTVRYFRVIHDEIILCI